MLDDRANVVLLGPSAPCAVRDVEHSRQGPRLVLNRQVDQGGAEQEDGQSVDRHPFPDSAGGGESRARRNQPGAGSAPAARLTSARRCSRKASSAALAVSSIARR